MTNIFIYKVSKFKFLYVVQRGIKFEIEKDYVVCHSFGKNKVRK